MGVFARLLRRSKATEEASTAETQADIRTADSAADAADAADATKATNEADEAPAAKEPTGTKAEEKADEKAEAGEASGAEDTQADTEAVGEAAAEDVEIPKQQSAEDAANREAGEGART
ncbi:hypothetical protein [Streptomyces sp. NRRL B-3229]|uniref:hypothetical protein n=1 Tax=Streptomyces sp. NRRL B-3229 TaxID=1463836 RepID=UPI0004C0C04B|nr:hypothetical protein [Streptomyces sp. NRRL B-3229]